MKRRMARRPLADTLHRPRFARSRRLAVSVRCRAGGQGGSASTSSSCSRSSSTNPSRHSRRRQALGALASKQQRGQTGLAVAADKRLLRLLRLLGLRLRLLRVGAASALPASALASQHRREPGPAAPPVRAAAASERVSGRASAARRARQGIALRRGAVAASHGASERVALGAAHGQAGRGRAADGHAQSVQD